MPMCYHYVFPRKSSVFKLISINLINMSIKVYSSVNSDLNETKPKHSFAHPYLRSTEIEDGGTHSIDRTHLL